MWYFIGVIVLIVVGVGVGFYFIPKKEEKKEECVDCTKDIPIPNPCDNGSCDKPIEKKLEVTIYPRNSNPKIPSGTFCTFSDAIVAEVKSEGLSCESCIKYEWFDNGAKILGQETYELKNVPVYRFNVNHYIHCMVSAEGLEASSAPAKLT